MSTNHNLVSGSQNTVTAGTLTTSEISHTHTDPYLDDELLSSLNPALRPATPDKDDPASMEKYEEHKKLLRQHLKVGGKKFHV